MNTVKVIKPQYPGMFGGAGFHNNDATMYHIIEKDHFDQYICKCYREISPGFMRTFAGFSDWTKEAMDEFAEYYEKMQKWTDTPMYLTPSQGKKHFSDEEIRDYCENVAERLAYLYYEKDVKHIRYYCFSNEMSCVSWGVLTEDLPLFKKYHEGFYSAFQKRNLPIGLLATDASGYESWTTTVDWALKNMADITEDICVHIYECDYSIYDLNFYDFFAEKCKEIVDKSIRRWKRVILGECGAQNDTIRPASGPNVVMDESLWFQNKEDEEHLGLMLTEMAFAAINSGVFAIAYWSFCDHPAPYSCRYSSGKDEYAVKWGESERFFSPTVNVKYNRWGFLKWDDENQDYGARAHYWCVSLLAKFFKRNSKVLEINVDDSNLRCCGIMNRDGSVSIGVVNRNKDATEIVFDCNLFQKNVRVYEYDSHNVPYNEFADMQDHSAILDRENVSYMLKPESVTYFTTDYIEKEKTVYAENVRINDDVLSWDDVECENHCYYRVYAADECDFIPTKENQIASTVANSIKVKKLKNYYKVLSVDVSGNV